MEFAYPRLTRLRAGNFVYPKLMAWEGALGVVPVECEGLVVSTEFPVFEVNEDRVLTEVLDVYFRTPAVWPKLSGASTGTNVRRRRLNPADFLNYEMPLPSRSVHALKKYGIDESAIPKVVAAGYGKLAEEIVRLALENGVKVREDKDLAEILATIELDSEIPSEALVAIAEILAYVYKANGTYQPAGEENDK